MLSGGARRTSSNPSDSEVSRTLSEQQLRDLRQIFDWLDQSGDGEISSKELLVALSAMSSGETMESAQALIHEATNYTKSTITWMEFCDVIQKSMKVEESSTAAQMFELLDTVGSGQLGPDALRAALQRWGCDASDHAVDKMVRYIDEDNDGQVSLQEFANALGRKMSQGQA